MGNIFPEHRINPKCVNLVRFSAMRFRREIFLSVGQILSRGLCEHELCYLNRVFYSSYLTFARGIRISVVFSVAERKESHLPFSIHNFSQGHRRLLSNSAYLLVRNYLDLDYLSFAIKRHLLPSRSEHSDETGNVWPLSPRTLAKTLRIWLGV